MKKKLTLIIGLFLFYSGLVLAQPVEVDLFQKTASATTSQIGVRVRATGANVDYIGVTFYILYQSSNAAPQSIPQNTVVGVDDSRMVTGFSWGSGSRFTNPAQVITTIDPGVAGGEVYNRRFVYGNSDDLTGVNTITLTTAWDTLLLITLNTLQPVYPQGGFAYLQSTSEAGGAALINPAFNNVPFSVNSGDRALGLTILPVLFSKFDAKCTNTGTLISWATTQEANSSKFEIERSTNGTTWTNIGSVPAAGNSTSDRAYQQIDLIGGTALYRIKQIDKDGQFIYTNVARTNCQVKNISSVIYPVPAQDVLNVVIKSDRSVRTQLMVFDMQGKLVKKLDAAITAGNNNFRINLIGLASGDYMLRSNDAVIQLNKIFTISR